MHGRKRLWFIVVSLLLLVLVVASVLSLLWARLDLDVLGQIVLSELSDRLGYEIRADDVSVAFLPPRLTLQGVRVLQHGPEGAPALFRARFLHTRLGLSSLLQGRPSLSTLVLDGAMTELRQGSSGKWIVSAPEPVQASGTPAPLPGSSASHSVPGESRVILQPRGMAPLEFSDVVISLRDVGFEKAFPFEIDCRFEEEGRVNVQGLLGPLTKEGSIPLPVSARVSLEQVDVLSLQGDTALQLSGWSQINLLEGKTRIEGEMAVIPRGESVRAFEWDLDGWARFQDLQVSPPKEGASLVVKSMRLDLGKDPLKLKLDGASLGGEPVRLEIEMTGASDRRIHFVLTGGKLDAPAWSQFLSGWQVGDGDMSEVAVKVLRHLAGNGEVQLRSLLLQGLRLKPLKGTITCDRGRIALDLPEVGLFSGIACAVVKGDLSRDEPRLTATGEVAGADVNEILSAADFGDRLAGRLQASFDLKTSLPAFSGATPVAGQVQFEVKDGLLHNVSLSESLTGLGQTFGIEFPVGDVPIERLSATFQVADGWARTDDLVLQTPELGVTAVGGISFEQEIKLDALARLKPESVKGAKSGAGGFVAILLQGLPVDRQGHVLFPFQVRGTLSRPRYAPDVARLTELQAKQRLPIPRGDPR